MPESDFLRAIRISEDAVKASNLQDAPNHFAYTKIQELRVPYTKTEEKEARVGASTVVCD